jgi:hypothetical protein
MIIEKPEVISAKIKALQIMIESTLNIVLSGLRDAEGWLEILNKLDNNGIMTSILNIKMMIRKQVEKEEISSQFIDAIKRIGIIKDTIERNDWYSQMEELEIYFKDLNGEAITIEVSQSPIPTPDNLRQTLLNHQDKPKNVEAIREEQEAGNYIKKLLNAQSQRKNSKEEKGKKRKTLRKKSKEKSREES